MRPPSERSPRRREDGSRECRDCATRPSPSIPGAREATNFYVWDSEEAARSFFTSELIEKVTGLYGVRPSVDFVQIATLVENHHR